MNKDVLHKILGVLLTLVVLIPFALQASHALESHEHVVCNAKDVKHFHNKELDCSIYHTPVENQSDGIDFTFELVTNKKFELSFENSIEATSYGFSSLKSSRAPPYFIV